MDTLTDKIIIAAYGTLRPGFGNNRLLSGSNHIGTGKTAEKYKMTANGIPFVKKNKKIHNVVVDLFEVDNNTLEKLDALEGHPEWYCREQIPVILNDAVVTAWLYFNNDYNHLPVIESGDYKNR